MKDKLLACCLVLMAMLSFGARAELVVEVTQGVDAPTPVAVVPFGAGGATGLPEDIAAIVSTDLARSGFFATMKRADMLSFPTRQDQVFFRDWRVSGQNYLLIGRIASSGGGQLEVAYELYDVLKEQRVFGEQVSGSTGNMRDIAHYIADQVFEKLTGLKGAFSTRIAYVTAESGGNGQHRYTLQLADSDGARARTILESREPILSPAWSRDGSKLAYVSFESSRPGIYVQHLATGKREKVQSFPGLNGAPAWAPDGQRLALTLSKDGNPEVYVLDLGQRQLTRLTHHYGIDTEPTWAPDGRSILFTSDRGGQPQIYRVYLADRRIERVTFEGNYNSSGKLTQDGRFLAMVHRSAGAGAAFNIAVQDLKTGRLDVLTQTRLDESPTIAPNGSVVLYATQEGNRGVLAAVSLDGRVRFRMPAASGDVREPAWSPYLQ
ncbi:protein TolB [Marinobacterium nitratireducens]|uniref:Tol-Pal system protein TolB n=1 Tax=Marinobacterium nitratireducens TaxID=518897 RepID=A0A917ZCW4_9GAMM|nr:Tol-Pal system beta propeller repeat protein TolB [Marinobacterium nitratireducens]GGO80680.1 protein TolB [Marinobacterium nitratireducens]